MTFPTPPTMPWPDMRQLQDDLQDLVSLESPSSDPDSVFQVMDRVQTWAEALGAECQPLPGGTRQFDFGVGSEPYILVLAHADTVWPHGSLEKMPQHVGGDKLYGPGSYDMKAGIVGLFHALRHLPEWPHGGIRILLSPDEEIGSLNSREVIEQAARRARVALIVEPPVADTHALKTGRKGTGSFVLDFSGIASHAGNRPELGASAITAAAEAVLSLQALARPERGTTVSVDRMAGGSAVNVIPDQCRLELDLRVSTLSEAERVDASIRAWQPSDPRIQVTVSGGLNRPPFEQSEQTLALFETARHIAATLGFDIGHEVVGGGSDGNFTAPLVPTLDGLGAPGDDAHAQHEHVRLDRWPDHVRLLAQLLQEV